METVDQYEYKEKLVVFCPNIAVASQKGSGIKNNTAVIALAGRMCTC